MVEALQAEHRNRTQKQIHLEDQKEKHNTRTQRDWDGKWHDEEWKKLPKEVLRASYSEKGTSEGCNCSGVGQFRFCYLLPHCFMCGTSSLHPLNHLSYIFDLFFVQFSFFFFFLFCKCAVYLFGATCYSMSVSASYFSSLTLRWNGPLKRLWIFIEVVCIWSCTIRRLSGLR